MAQLKKGEAELCEARPRRAHASTRVETSRRLADARRNE